MGLKVGMITSWKVRCGIATYSDNLTKALASLGAECYIIRMPRFGQKSPEMLQNVIDSMPADKLDVIHVQHEYGIWQGLEGSFFSSLKQLGKPIVTTMHSAGQWELDGIIASCSTKIVVHNEYCARRFNFPSVIIPHGCSPAECTPSEEAKQSVGIDPRSSIVGYCGFISNYKGLETLIEAMIEVPNAGLLIAGGWHAGPGTEYSTKLRQRSLELLPKRCQWLGYVPDERLPNAYGAMDIVVYPSRFATESGALLMAISYNKAVLASNIQPFREKEKVDALMTFKDIEDLRVKIKQLLENKELRLKLEQQARNYAKNNSWSAIAEKHLTLYQSL